MSRISALIRDRVSWVMLGCTLVSIPLSRISVLIRDRASWVS
ncbi:hypothetical protein [Coleofasciculus chthonoplastes]|nr:hypothetical protein [Coleofasciculus chthonoplastes]